MNPLVSLQVNKLVPEVVAVTYVVTIGGVISLLILIIFETVAPFIPYCVLKS